MTAKEYLRQAYMLDKVINSKMDSLTELRSLAEKASSVMTGLPGSPIKDNSKIENTIIKIMDAEQELNEIIDKLVDLKREISRCIDCVPNREQAFLLEQRYIHCKKWEEVGREFNYTPRNLMRAHKRALMAIEKYIPQN